MSTINWSLDLNTVVLLLVALMTSFNLYYTRKTEKNTNSMKDALVARTGEAAHAQGRAEGIAEGVVRAEGVREGKAESNA